MYRRQGYGTGAYHGFSWQIPNGYCSGTLRYLYAYAIDDFWDDKNAGENLKRRWDTHFGLEVASEEYIELFNKARAVTEKYLKSKG